MITLIMTNVFLGLTFIVIGFITLKSPWTIKQWRYASEEKRKNIDIKGLQELYCKSMVCGGLGLILVGIVNYFVKGNWSLYALMMIVFAMTGYMIARTRRYDKNPKSKKEMTIAATVVALSLFLVVGLFIGGKMESKVTVDENGLTIGGMYGFTIAKENIDTIYMAMMNELPKVKMRTNGYNDGQVAKGNFRLDEWGACKLFIHNANEPVIVIKSEGKYTILNLYEAETTKNLYNELQNF